MTRNGITGAGAGRDRRRGSSRSRSTASPNPTPPRSRCIAYASAYLKAHHGAAFLCALLNNWPMGFYHPATLVTDAGRHGIETLPIDVHALRAGCCDARGRRGAARAPRPALRARAARGDRHAGSPGGAGGGAVRSLADFHARASQANEARAGDAGRGRRARAAGRHAAAGALAGRGARALGRAVRAGRPPEQHDAGAAAGDERARGDGGRVPRHRQSPPGRTRSPSCAPSSSAGASRARPTWPASATEPARRDRRHRGGPPAPGHRQGVRVHHPRGRDRLRQRHRLPASLRALAQGHPRVTARWSSKGWCRTATASC